MTQNRHFTYELAAPRRERIPPLALLAGVFIVGAVAFATLPGFNYAVKAVGVLLAIGYVFFAFRQRRRIAGEVYVYLLWFLWAGLGVLIAPSPLLFWDKWQTVFQMWVLLVILSGFTESRRILSFNLQMFLLAALIVGGYSLITGEFQKAEAEGTRVAGLTLNANAFGITMLMATVCMAYLWMNLSRNFRGLKYGLLIAGMTGAAMSVVLSGSRKSLLSLMFFYTLWVFFCYRKEVFRRAQVLLIILLAVGLGGYGMYRMLSGSELTDRLSRTWEAITVGGNVKDSGSERIALYNVAGQLIAENPIMGVGLHQFVVINPMHEVAHSEYAEVAADTGLVGAAIYFLWYIFLWRRAGKIAKWSPEATERRTAGLIRAVLLTMLALGFGCWFFDSKFAWVIMGSFIGYTNVVWVRIRAEQAGGYYQALTEDMAPAGYLAEA